MFFSLENRAVFELSGPDAKSFLQSLITNDIYKLPKEALYAFLLTPQGKYLYDFFLVEHDNKILLEYEKKYQKEIIQQLKKYKVGINISLKATKYHVYSTFNRQLDYDVLYFTDTRNANMGTRIFSLKTLEDTTDQKYYERQRIQNAVPDGARDLISGCSFPFEGDIDYAIDFEKGCYIGQEVIARTTSRGVIRKKLFMVEGEEVLENICNNITDDNDKTIGELRSTCGNIGLALLKIEDAQQAIKKIGHLFASKVKIKVHKLL